MKSNIQLNQIIDICNLNKSRYQQEKLIHKCLNHTLKEKYNHIISDYIFEYSDMKLNFIQRYTQLKEKFKCGNLFDFIYAVINKNDIKTLNDVALMFDLLESYNTTHTFSIEREQIIKSKVEEIINTLNEFNEIKLYQLDYLISNGNIDNINNIQTNLNIQYDDVIVSFKPLKFLIDFELLTKPKQHHLNEYKLFFNTKIDILDYVLMLMNQ